MKNFMLTMILTAALIAVFSFYECPQLETPNGIGWGTKHKGDSGLIIPGDGESPADTFIEPESIPEQAEETEEVVSKMEITTDATVSKTESGVTSEVRSEEIKEEHNKVNGMIIAFWHGVSAVLIGEASALLVAFAWMKIRGGKDGK